MRYFHSLVNVQKCLSLLDAGVYTRWKPLSSFRGTNWQRPQGQEEGQRQGQEIRLEPWK